MIPRNASADLADSSRAGESDSIFGAPFWFTFGSNLALTMASALFFRYADFVRLIGGSDFDLGCIVGAGMIGSLLFRVYQGVAIDIYGSRVVWITSTIMFLIACLLHAAAPIQSTLWAYPLRLLYQVSISGFFSGSITFIAGRAPPTRMAEVIGNLGISGFLGMIFGTYLGDTLLGLVGPGEVVVDRLFYAASALAGISLVCTCFATRGGGPILRRRQPPLFAILRRYRPGSVLLAGVATGFGLTLPQIFLRPFLLELRIDALAAFFAIYPLIGLLTRFCIRRFPERYGVRPMIVIGLGSLAAGMVSFIPVQGVAHLALPALFMGIAHAFLFPSVVAGGSSFYPVRFRGVGTTVVLSMFDIGALIGMPLSGTILTWAAQAGWPRFITLFWVVALLDLAVIALFLADRRQPRVKLTN